MPSVQVIHGAFTFDAISMFRERGWKVVQHTPDVVCWLGGIDISPRLYGEEAIRETYYNARIDEPEITIFKAYPASIPKIGICRGGQLLNVLSGGKMWQHTNHHGSPHAATDVETGALVQVSSIHHQMMRPSQDARILTTARMSTFVKAQREILERKDEEYDDIEAVYYPNTNSLCYQGHPEVDGPAGVEYFFSLVNKTLGL